jgi:hypothetical protein
MLILLKRIDCCNAVRIVRGSNSVVFQQHGRDKKNPRDGLSPKRQTWLPPSRSMTIS